LLRTRLGHRVPSFSLQMDYSVLWISSAVLDSIDDCVDDSTARFSIDFFDEVGGGPRDGKNAFDLSDVTKHVA
jgi:hypothetical protein